MVEAFSYFLRYFPWPNLGHLKRPIRFFSSQEPWEIIRVREQSWSQGLVDLQVDIQLYFVRLYQLEYRIIAIRRRIKSYVLVI